MAKQKVYVQETYVYEYEFPVSEEDNTDEIEECIKRIHPTNSIGAEFGHTPASTQYMVEDSEWVEIHDMSY